MFGDGNDTKRTQPVKIEVRITSEGQGGAGGGQVMVLMDDSGGRPVGVANANGAPLTTGGTANKLTAATESAIPKVSTKLKTYTKVNLRKN